MKTVSSCCAPDCNTTVAPGLYFCSDCWALVPQANREAMREAYRPPIALNLPLHRAVLVSKHQDAVLAAARAIVRPVTAPEPEIHLCAGARAPADLVPFVAHAPGDVCLADWARPLEWEAQPYDVRLPSWSTPLKWTDSRMRRAARQLLRFLAPCWAMGLAPSRDALLTLAVRTEAELMPSETALTPPEWAEALAALIRAGAVVERLYGRARSA